MAAKTTWGPAPWLKKETWLLKDNSVMQTPDLESTTSGQRVRVAGTKQSFGKSQVDTMVREAAKELAASRLTELWVPLLNEDSDRRMRHGGVSPGPGRMPDYDTPAKFHLKDTKSSEHTQITFEYVSEDCPALTATVWVIVQRYGGNRAQVQTGLTYQILHDSHFRNPEFVGWQGKTDDWWTPFGYYDHTPAVDRAKEFLQNFEPVPGITFGTEGYNQPRHAAVDVIKAVKVLIDTEYIDVPVWRESETVSTMRYKFKRSNFTNNLYQEMVEFVQVKPTLDRIKENYNQIKSDLAALGIVMKQTSNDSFFEIVERAFAEDVVCHMIPVTDDEPDETTPTVVPDQAHSVSVDLLSGTIVVNCSQRDTEVLEHWNFERTKAELHGELDAFLGFARSKNAKRTRKTFTKIVKDRTPEEISLDDLSA